MSAPRTDDSCIYEPEAVDIGVMLFGSKTCVVCGETLANCADYFPPRGEGTLRGACRRCVRARERRNRQERKARK